MEINCAYTEVVSISELKPNPKNANKHTPEQVKLLAKIMKAQGWRHPVVVSKRSGFLVAGHARIEAAKINKWTEAPVDYQDFPSDELEYAFLVADNEIARLAKADLSMVLKEVLDFGPEFDFDLLGIPDFKLPEDLEKPKTENKQSEIECPACGTVFEKGSKLV